MSPILATAIPIGTTGKTKERTRPTRSHKLRLVAAVKIVYRIWLDTLYGGIENTKTRMTRKRRPTKKRRCCQLLAKKVSKASAHDFLQV